MKKITQIIIGVLLPLISFSQAGEMFTMDGGYVDLGAPAARNFGNTGDPFCIEFYVNDADITSEYLGLSNGNLTIQSSSGTLSCFLSDGGVNNTTLTGTISAGTWHHVALSMNAGAGSNNKITLWVDFTLEDSTEVSWDPDLDASQYYLGALSTTPTNEAEASFDELRFWDASRTADDIRWYTNDTILSGTAEGTGLAGYFTFNDMLSTLVDSTGNANGTSTNATSPTIETTTAPVPFYTVAVGDLFDSSTWASGQGVPPIPSTYTKIWLQNTYNKLAAGDPDFILGAITVQYDTTGVDGSSGNDDDRSQILYRRSAHINAYSGTTSVGDFVVRGAGHHVYNTMTITRSIQSQSRPGNCPSCGDAQLYIEAGGQVNFQGTSVSFRNGVINISGIIDVKTGGHTLNLTNTEININSGGLLLSEASGANTWNLGGGTVNIAYGGGITNTQHTTSPITGSPTINIETQISGSDDGWRHFSSPSVGGTIADFDDDLTFNFAGSATYNAYWWDPTESGVTGVANGWTAITSTTRTTDVPFVVYESNGSFPVKAGGTVDISNAAIGSGDQTWTLYNYYDPNADQLSQNKGWNMISNPYPGAFNLNTFINDYNGDGGGDNPSEFPLAYQGVHVWDARTRQYIPYLASGETVIEHDNSADSTAAPITANSSSFVRPFQSFWVKMSDADGDGTTESLTLQNQHRHTFRMIGGNQEYHKTTFPKLRLNVEGPDDRVDQSLIVFNPQTDDSWNAGHEAYDLLSMDADVPSMWIPTADGTQSIYSTDLQNGTTKAIPVVIRAGQSGVHSFDFVEDDYDANYGVWIVDSVAQVAHSLRDGAYSFMLPNAGDERTLWVFANTANISIPEYEKDELYVLDNGAYWRIQMEDVKANATIHMTDMSGRVLGVYTMDSDILDLPKPEQSGIYILILNEPGAKPLPARVVNL